MRCQAIGEVIRETWSYMLGFCVFLPLDQYKLWTLIEVLFFLPKETNTQRMGGGCRMFSVAVPFSREGDQEELATCQCRKTEFPNGSMAQLVSAWS